MEGRATCLLGGLPFGGVLGRHVSAALLLFQLVFLVLIAVFFQLRTAGQAPHKRATHG
jgi:hypothetical protein